MIKLAFGAGSSPCKQRHTMSMEIELARPTTQVGTCPLLGLLVALLALAIFCRWSAAQEHNSGRRFRRLAEYVFAPGIPLARAQGGSAAPSGDAKRQSGEAAHNELRQGELCSLTSPAERPIHLSR